jgi:spermidine synthase
LADRHPHHRLLGQIVLAAAWATAGIGLSKTWVLEFLQGAGNLHTLAIVATIALFAPAAILLGMVPPFAVRLCLEDPAHGGRTAGSLYAISTIGSIFGTFFAGFVLIAWVGSTSILFITAATLVLASWLAEPGNRLCKGVSLAVFVLAIFFCRQHDSLMAQRGFLDTDTPYNRVLVYTSKEEGTNRPTRELVTGPQGRQSAMYLDDPTELALPYTRFYRLAELYQPNMRRMLVLGGGGFSFPKYGLAHYPELQIDVVELDPGMTALARSHFGLMDHHRLKIIEADARTFLHRVEQRYDVILCDVFTSHYSIPFHLVTTEAVERMRSALNPGGVVLVNLLASPEGGSSRFYKALYATFQTAFPVIQSYAVFNPADLHLWQNLILVASAAAPPPASAKDADIARMLTHALPAPLERIPPFTDEFAPVDRYLAEFGLKTHHLD